MWAALAGALKAVAAFFGWRDTVEKINAGVAKQVARDEDDEIENMRRANIAAGDVDELERVRDQYEIKRPIQ